MAKIRVILRGWQKGSQMQIKEKTIEALKLSIKILPKLPAGTYFGFSYNGGLQIEASTQEEVKKIRRCFRGVIWKKNFIEWSERWEYTTTTKTGLDIRINGVTEGPKQCKMIEETVMEERSVPESEIKYVKKMVEVKKIRYICPETDKA